MNYTGGKYRLLPQILPLFPPNSETFVDLFCGGCSVGINVSAKRHIYNDTCAPLIELYREMQALSADAFVEQIYKIINRYQLSDSRQHGYAFYECVSSSGLGKFNKPNYLKLRDDFNAKTKHDTEYYSMFYVLIVYAFNNQIRFNKDGKFNLPVGKRDFNQKMEAKLRQYMAAIQTQKSDFYHFDFREFDYDMLEKGDFVYADPPYLITCAAYNERDGWTEQEETALLTILDDLDSRGIYFALSNVMDAKGKQNEFLYDWTKKHFTYRIVDLNYSYKNANYHRKAKESNTREVLITNYTGG